MLPAPAAGSATRNEVGFLDQQKLGVARDPAREASGSPSAAVNGSTVTASAPPRPAENVAMVVRSMFT